VINGERAIRTRGKYKEGGEEYNGREGGREYQRVREGDIR
jgi:hypothetical protein